MCSFRCSGFTLSSLLASAASTSDFSTIAELGFVVLFVSINVGMSNCDKFQTTSEVSGEPKR